MIAEGLIERGVALLWGPEICRFRNYMLNIWRESSRGVGLNEEGGVSVDISAGLSPCGMRNGKGRNVNLK